MLLMSVAIYFGFTNAYSTNVNALTVKIVGLPIYELTKSGTEYAGKSMGIYMGAVCGICMALSVIAEELISKAGRKQATVYQADKDGSAWNDPYRNA